MNSRALLAIAALMAAGLTWGAWRWLGSVDAGPTALLQPDSSAPTTSTTPAELAEAKVVTLPVASRAEAARAVAASPATVRCTTGRLSGRVTSNANHGAITQGEVVATLMGQRAGRSICRLDTTGAYEFTALTSGNWTVACTAQGYTNQELQVFIPDEDRTRTLDFLLVPVTPPVSFSVYLRGADGRAFRDTIQEGKTTDSALLLRVLCLESCPPHSTNLPVGASILPSHASAVQADRWARKSEQPAGDPEWFRVKLDHQVSGCCCLLLGDFVLDAVPFSGSTTRIDMIVTADYLQRVTGSVRLIAYDAVSQAPLVSAEVRIRSDSALLGTGVTDSSGLVIIDRLAPGVADVEVVASGHLMEKGAVVIQPGRETDLSRVPVRPK